MILDPTLLIDGVPATTDDLTYLAMVSYGAFTSFRVEGGGVRGLDRHLERLDGSAVALFGAPLDETRLRELIRIAVAGRGDCWLRISLFSPEIRARNPSWRGAPKVMTVVSPPPSPLAETLRVAVQAHVRHLPEIKHTSTLDLIHARRIAREAGFDDALFADDHGVISEGSSWNIGFVKGDMVTWPQAPMLAGVTQGLIESGLIGVGMVSETRPVRVSDLGDFDSAFICNSTTPACAVTAIGNRGFEPDSDRIAAITTAWASNTPQTI
jgi:branched-subunit amino acid aminotransferase/4-amino-4-deoxychorismate lyase